MSRPHRRLRYQSKMLFSLAFMASGSTLDSPRLIKMKMKNTNRVFAKPNNGALMLLPSFPQEVTKGQLVSSPRALAVLSVRGALLLGMGRGVVSIGALIHLDL